MDKRKTPRIACSYKLENLQASVMSTSKSAMDAQLLCVFCHATFPTPDSLLAHIRIHTGDTLPPDVITLDGDETDEETISVGSPEKVPANSVSSPSIKESPCSQLDVVNCDNFDLNHNCSEKVSANSVSSPFIKESPNSQLDVVNYETDNFDLDNNCSKDSSIRCIGKAVLSNYFIGVEDGIHTNHDKVNSLNAYQESNQIDTGINTDDQSMFETSPQIDLQNQKSNKEPVSVTMHRVKRQLLQQFDDLEKPNCEMSMLKIVSVQGSYLHEKNKQGDNDTENSDIVGSFPSQSLAKLPEFKINPNHDYCDNMLPALSTSSRLSVQTDTAQLYTQSRSSLQVPPVKINSDITSTRGNSVLPSDKMEYSPQAYIVTLHSQSHSEGQNTGIVQNQASSPADNVLLQHTQGEQNLVPPDKTGLNYISNSEIGLALPAIASSKAYNKVIVTKDGHLAPHVEGGYDESSIVKPLSGKTSVNVATSVNAATSVNTATSVNIATSVKTKPLPIPLKRKPVSVEVPSTNNNTVNGCVQKAISSTVSAMISPVEDFVLYKPTPSSKDKFVTGSSETEGLQSNGSGSNVMIVSSHGLGQDIPKYGPKISPKLSKRKLKGKKRRFSPYRSRQPEAQLACSKLKEFTSKITDKGDVAKTASYGTESKKEELPSGSKKVLVFNSSSQAPNKKMPDDSTTKVLEKSSKVAQEPENMLIADTTSRIVAPTVKAIRFRCPSCKKGFQRVTQQMHHKCKGKSGNKSLDLDTAFDKLKMFKCLYCHAEFGTLQEKNDHHCTELSNLKKSINSSSDSDNVLINLHRIKKRKVGRPSKGSIVNVKGVKKKLGRPPKGAKIGVGYPQMLDSEYYKYKFQCHKCDQRFLKESWLRVHYASCETPYKTTSSLNNLPTQEDQYTPEVPQIPSISMEADVSREPLVLKQNRIMQTKTSNMNPQKNKTKKSPVHHENVQCKGCQRSFRYRFNLRIHLKHRRDCNSAFDAQELDELHNRQPKEQSKDKEDTDMDRQQPPTCPFCPNRSRDFQSVQFLSMHTLYAHKIKVYAEGCEWYFDDIKAPADNQVAMSNQGSLKESLKCSLCHDARYVFLGKDSYEMHTKAKHSVTNSQHDGTIKGSLSTSKNKQPLSIDSSCDDSHQSNVKSAFSLLPNLQNKMIEITSEKQDSSCDKSLQSNVKSALSLLPNLQSKMIELTSEKQDSSCDKSLQSNVKSALSLLPNLQNKMIELTSDKQEKVCKVGTCGTEKPCAFSKSEVGKGSSKMFPATDEGTSKSEVGKGSKKVLPAIDEGTSGDFIFEETQTDSAGLDTDGIPTTELKQGRYKCLHCTFTSTSFAETSIHLMLQHNIRQPTIPTKISTHKDPEKLKKFISVQKATSPSFHKVSDEVSICTMCDKGVAAENIQLHVKKHLMHRLYKCSFCECTSFHRGNIKKHLKSEHSDAIKGLATISEANRKTADGTSHPSDTHTKTRKLLPSLANKAQGTSRSDTKSRYFSDSAKSRCLPQIMDKGISRSETSTIEANDTVLPRVSKEGSKGSKKSPVDVNVHAQNETKQKKITRTREETSDWHSNHTKYWRSKHIKYVKDSPQPYQCQTCDFQANTSDKVINHVVYAHLYPTRWFKECYIYNAEPKNEAYELAKTMSKDKTSGMYLCCFCKAEFSKGSIALHLLQHTGGHPYQCRLCTYKCKQPVSIYKHVGYYHSEEEYIARICTDKGGADINDQSFDGVESKTSTERSETETGVIDKGRKRIHDEQLKANKKCKTICTKAKQSVPSPNKKHKTICTNQSAPSPTKDIKSDKTDRLEETEGKNNLERTKQSHIERLPHGIKSSTVAQGDCVDSMKHDHQDKQKEQDKETVSNKLGLESEVEQTHSEIGGFLEDMLQKGEKHGEVSKSNKEISEEGGSINWENIKKRYCIAPNADVDDLNNKEDGGDCSSTCEGASKVGLDHPKPVHPCMDCDMVFESRKDLTDHRNKHSMRMCVFCNFKSAHLVIMLNHTNLCHKDVKNASSLQPILIKYKLDCNEINIDVPMLDVIPATTMKCFMVQKSSSYQKLIKGSDNGNFNCAICGFESNSYAELEVHIKEHYENKAYHCLVCCYRCSQQEQIVEHVARHFKDSQKVIKEENPENLTVETNKDGLDTVCVVNMSDGNDTRNISNIDKEMVNEQAGSMSEQILPETCVNGGSQEEGQYTKQTMNGISSVRIKIENEICSDNVTTDTNDKAQLEAPNETMAFDDNLNKERIPDFSTKHDSADVVTISHEDRSTSEQSTKSQTEGRIGNGTMMDMMENSKDMTVGSLVEQLVNKKSNIPHTEGRIQPPVWNENGMVKDMMDKSKDLTVGSYVEKLMNSQYGTSSYNTQSDENVVVVDCEKSEKQKEIPHDMNQGDGGRSVWQPWLYNVVDKQTHGHKENSMPVIDAMKYRQMDSLVSLDISDCSDTYLADETMRRNPHVSSEEITDDIMTISTDGKIVKPRKIYHSGQCTKDVEGISVDDMFEKLTNSFGKSSTSSPQLGQNMARSDNPVATSTPYGQMMRMNYGGIAGDQQPPILQPWTQDF